MGNFFDTVLTTEIWQGKALNDYLTLDAMLGLAGNVIAAIAILVIGSVAGRWLKRRVEGIGHGSEHLDTTLFEFLGDIVRYAVLAFSAVFVLNTFGVQTASIVAVIGAAGLAIGLALQGTLSNIAAGVMIILFRPVRIGDFVEVNGQTGTVREISLNYTELQSIGNVQIIVPNSEVWGNTIINYSSYPKRRAEWSFGVGYGANLKTAEDAIRKVITGDARTLNDDGLFLQVNNLGDSSVDFLCRAYVKTEDYWQYQADMKRLVKEELDAQGVDIPFPTRTLVQAAPDGNAGNSTAKTGSAMKAEDEARTESTDQSAE